MVKHTDFLVVGSGIAGLSFALKVADFGKVCVLTKANVEENSTKHAQGGIAAVMVSPDTYEKHIHDTLIAGDGFCDEHIVRLTVSESTERIEELIAWGTRFDKTRSGSFDLAREGGHSEHRILHFKDQTGDEIERALIAKAKNHPNIEILENQFTVDIITQHHLGEEVTRRRPDICCYGAYALNTETHEIDTYLAKITMIATGGAGHVYSTTTNPIVSTGDGVAMVFRAKGKVNNMEFFQFHPTSLYNPGEKPSFLVSEAVRGFGGILKNLKGEEFMSKYDERKELAPRDIVARAIDSEMKLSGDDHVFLDCRHLNKNALISHFPTIYAKCLSIGIDMHKDLIPVVPAAHYSCGGIAVNEHGQSSIQNLYASGECACTGLHGANRLASNSLLEAVVFSHRSAMHAIEQIKQISFNKHIPEWNAEGMVLNEEMILITQSLKEVEALMSNYVGIVRSDLRLQRAFERLKLIYKETEALYDKSVLTVPICELRNIIEVSYVIIKSAQERRQNCGLHYSIDLI
ncbi:MAG: L-aspartate oxidase [Bacteroidales bacterium]|jgi:L-aspartate oxidase|nr:L-aspartate oxidase [Bacteroidales bacterium]